MKRSRLFNAAFSNALLPALLSLLATSKHISNLASALSEIALSSQWEPGHRLTLAYDGTGPRCPRSHPPLQPSADYRSIRSSLFSSRWACEDPEPGVLIWPQPWRMVTLTRTWPLPHPQGYICSFPSDTQVVRDIEASPWGSICFLQRGQGRVVIKAWTWSPLHFPIKWAVYAGRERTVNNECVMLNMKHYSRCDTLNLSFLDHTNPFVPSQSRGISKMTKPHA